MHKRVGAIHFFRVWRFRFSFCMAAPVASLGVRSSHTINNSEVN